VKENLKSACHISLTTDGWTSKATQSYITITAHYIAQDWLLQSAVLQTRPLFESHTAENLSNVLNGAVQEWGLEKSFSISGDTAKYPIAITSDNAQNIVKGISLSQFKPHVRCFAHCLNLAAYKALDHPTVSRLLGRVVTYFHQSSTATKVLNDKQKALGLPQHKLLQDVKPAGIQVMIWYTGTWSNSHQFMPPS
jgi:hypothetical protein